MCFQILWQIFFVIIRITIKHIIKINSRCGHSSIHLRLQRFMIHQFRWTFRCGFCTIFSKYPFCIIFFDKEDSVISFGIIKIRRAMHSDNFRTYSIFRFEKGIDFNIINSFWLVISSYVKYCSTYNVIMIIPKL